ncbi:MAG: TlpA disulfide reductase family protein [Candidatus Marinimicrobia bacterium]|nr:TlpA disulfide reductase family protein [Candidatus Neomarinimicrobiota bacterium]
MRTILMITLLITTVWCTDSLSTKNPGLAMGSQAPRCFAKTIGGKDFFLSRHVGPRARNELKGPVVFSFFTTSCLPCRKEIPFLHALKEEYPELSIYLVNVGEDPETVQSYVDKMNYTLPVLLDRYGKISDNYSAKVTPTLIVINRAGAIEFYKQGFTDADTSTIMELFKQLTTD